MTTAVAQRNAAVFDLEGLIDVSGIRHLAKNAAAFSRASLGCPANRDVVSAARRAHKSGKTVLVITGGDRRLEQLVAAWLRLHRVPSTLVMMRCRGDYRPGPVVKRERLRAARLRFAGFEVWSGDQNVARLLEQDGIDVTVVPGWEDEQ